jgi:hypothetical protein
MDPTRQIPHLLCAQNPAPTGDSGAGCATTVPGLVGCSPSRAPLWSATLEHCGYCPRDYVAGTPDTAYCSAGSVYKHVVPVSVKQRHPLHAVLGVINLVAETVESIPAR